jgi:tRNA dimethylallyltransferase
VAPRPSKTDVASGAKRSSNLPIIVAGPTAVGKTALALELANRLEGEIIGADAFQVYRGLETLTGQPSQEILSAVPHHLIGFLPPTEAFDAARFVLLARRIVREVLSRGKLPILVGGSGLYIKALTHGLADVPAADPVLRGKLAALSPHQLREELRKVDPSTEVDLQNPRRVLRALEISLLAGRPASSLQGAWKKRAVSGFRGLLLVRKPAELHARIAENVRAMFERGVVAEVAKIQGIGPTAAMAIGFREIKDLLRNKITEPECIQAVTLATRRYAKRQLTWFRNQFSFEIIDLTGLRDTHEILPLAMESLGAA